MLSFSKSALCLLLASPLIAAVIATGCSDTTTSGNTGAAASTESSSTTAAGGSGNGSVGGAGGASGGTGGTASSTASSGVGGNGGFIEATCLGKTYQCGDAIDNDMDGLIDSQDPDCLGPCDNSENGLNLDIPGGDGPGCYVDCYWDSNSGSGNDGCYWNHRCDPLSPEGSACAYNPNANTPGTPFTCNELQDHQPASCLDVCPQLVPNGCDCFGCCVLYNNGIEYGPVWLGTVDPIDKKTYTCEIDKLGTPQQNTACAPCTQVKNECYNGCGKCELCIGKTIADLPPECFQQPPPPDAGVDSGMPSPDSGLDSGMPPPQCPTGVQACGLPGQPLCPVGAYCITGCCVVQPK